MHFGIRSYLCYIGRRYVELISIVQDVRKGGFGVKSRDCIIYPSVLIRDCPENS